MNATSQLVKSGNFQVHCGNVRRQYFSSIFFMLDYIIPLHILFIITKDFCKPFFLSTLMAIRMETAMSSLTINEVEVIKIRTILL